MDVPGSGNWSFRKNMPDIMMGNECLLDFSVTRSYNGMTRLTKKELGLLIKDLKDLHCELRDEDFRYKIFDTFGSSGDKCIRDCVLECEVLRFKEEELEFGKDLCRKMNDGIVTI